MAPVLISYGFLFTALIYWYYYLRNQTREEIKGEGTSEEGINGEHGEQGEMQESTNGSV